MSEFDWVKARSECSIGVIFEQLKRDLQSDVDKNQALRPEPAGLPCFYGFRLAIANTGRAAAVIVEGTGIHDSVTFRLTDTAIEVVGNDGKLRFQATPTLNSKGECRLKINGEEYEAWYLRKMALEDIFFHDYFR
jgi:hypothetical protein